MRRSGKDLTHTQHTHTHITHGLGDVLGCSRLLAC